MNTISAPDIKRKGIGIVDEALNNGPVHIIRKNKLNYVIMSEDSYRTILHDLAEARLTASEADIAAGRIEKGTVEDLMDQITSTD